MNSEYDITLHPDEPSSPGMARERFLDSLGLGETGPSEPEVESVIDYWDDEGVVLSAQPDDLELPAIDSDSLTHRAVSFSLGSSSEHTRTVPGSITSGENAPDADASLPKAESWPDKNANSDVNLKLECPECHGELALQRRHIGIEGLCVWCHTPLIAAESARDSIVRIFPVLGRITKPDTAAVPVAPAPAPVVETKVETTRATASSEGIAEEIPAVAEASVVDLDALYATGSFGQPSPETGAPTAGFGESFAASFLPEGPETVAPVSGFDSFLPAEDLEKSAALSWGPPAKPAFAPNAPVSLEDDFATAFPSSGFGSPAASSEFGSFTAPGQASASVERTPASLSDDFAAAFAPAGFGMPVPDPSPTAAPLVGSAETPDFSFHSSPASTRLFGGDTMEENRPFATPGSSRGISEPIGLSSPDDAPVALSSGPMSAHTVAPGAAPPFADSSFPVFTDVSAITAPGTPFSLFSEDTPVAAPVMTGPPATAGIPPLPQPQEPTFSSLANPIGTAAPIVVSEPLGTKPKPKVRKGFIVLMVVIVGFAAGAALASFVLPVDQYVQTARSLMEKKFNSASSAPVLEP